MSELEVSVVELELVYLLSDITSRSTTIDGPDSPNARIDITYRTHELDLPDEN